MSFWGLLLDLHLTTHHSSAGVILRSISQIVAVDLKWDTASIIPFSEGRLALCVWEISEGDAKLLHAMKLVLL